MASLKTDVATAVDAKGKAERDREDSKSQLAVLENEKAALINALEEAKAARDEAIATASSIKSDRKSVV